MNIAEIEEMVSRAIAQLERAKLRLVNSLDICYPRMVGAKERAEIINVSIDLVMAHNEIRFAADITMDVFKKLRDFTQANEESNATK